MSDGTERKEGRSDEGRKRQGDRQERQENREERRENREGLREYKEERRADEVERQGDRRERQDDKKKRCRDNHRAESGEILSRAVYFPVLGSFLFALVYLFVRAVSGVGAGHSGELRIIIFQLVMGCVFLRLPIFISRVTRARIPAGLSVGYFAFLWCAIFLGEFALLYYRVAVWDSLLHLFSAALAALAALSLPPLLGVRDQPLISALVAVGAALTLGLAWEVYEFAFDGLLGLNMQKFATLTAATDLGAADGRDALAPLVGRAALVDTMTDLILDFLGASAVGIWGYLRIKRHGDLPRAIKITIHP